MSQQVSLYILTQNSAAHLPEILKRSRLFADEILIVDSGSTDNTLAIAENAGCKILYRTFDNFREQRAFAISQCSYDWILSFDSDEIPTVELGHEINQLKQHDFAFDAYTIQRKWFVLGRPVHVMYPVVSPDYPIRLFNRKKVGYDERSTAVHETPHGYKTLGRIQSVLEHHTFETITELKQKLAFYTTIAAQDLIERKKTVSVFKLLLSPIAAWVKWYLIKGGWKDGSVGVTLGKYVFEYTLLKYRKARATQ